MATYELENDTGDRVVLNGNRIAFVNTGNSTKLRWIELSIFERDAGGYVYHTVGKSVVFHEEGALCAKGNRVAVTELDLSEFERCPHCKAGTDPSSGHIVLEEDFHTLKMCDTIQDVYSAAKVRGELTGPSRQLLLQVADQREQQTINL